MGRLIFQRKIPLKFHLILLVCLPITNQAQSIKRQCISSYAAVVTINNATFGQTVGQPYTTTGSCEVKTAILQGFQQPVAFLVEKINSEIMKSLIFNVYPSPATYSVIIQSEEVIENSIIHVTDLNGKLILSEQVAQLLTYNINCTSWKNGIYIITIRDKNQNKSSLKISINK